ncbi:hypothetical protein J7E70_21875 [Variovorax paradoxus]|nr:hypothetical protein [Variovorax paradoxus]MBT2303103.1 hypothetical protein [Variovorax paradoxus]
MKHLEMPETQRTEFSERSLLAINSKGQEVLHGLNFDESQFFVDCARAMPSGAAELDRYTDLSRRHEAARFKLASVDDESTGEEDGPPRLAGKF